MSDEKPAAPPAWTGRQNEAQKVISQVQDRFSGVVVAPRPDGQTVSAERLEKMQGKIASQSAEDHFLEAAGFTEDLVKFLAGEFVQRGFTPEQGVFSVVLALVNLRETFPEKNGGKQTFDRVYKDAVEYYRKNAG